MFLIDGASRVTAPKEARPQALFRFALPWVGFVGYVRELFIKSVEREYAGMFAHGRWSPQYCGDCYRATLAAIKIMRSRF
jgi:hypothetical protein